MYIILHYYITRTLICHSNLPHIICRNPQKSQRLQWTRPWSLEARPDVKLSVRDVDVAKAIGQSLGFQLDGLPIVISFSSCFHVS